VHKPVDKPGANRPDSPIDNALNESLSNKPFTMLLWLGSVVVLHSKTFCPASMHTNVLCGFIGAQQRVTIAS